MAHGSSHDDVKKQVRIYLGVFAALGVLTVLTVAVSYLHMPLFWAVLAALAIASFKGTLVAGFFMHLFSEQKIILCILLLTFSFFIVLLFLPAIFHY